MPDNFNPYAEWLGLDASVTSPDHFQLLGIHESVTDAAAIASAADRAIVRVRACKPGPHAAAWAQLLDRISAAKKTLTDPAQRQSYRQQLTAPAAAVAPVNPNQQPPAPSATYPAASPPPLAQAIDPMAPVMMSPPQAAQQVAQPTPTAAIPMAVPYQQPAAAAVAAPNPMAPVASAAPTAPAIPQAMPDPMAPVALAAPFAHTIPPAPSPPTSPQPAAPPAPTPMQAIPFAAPPSTPVAGPMLASQPRAATQTQTLDGAPKLKRTPTATARAHAKSRSMLGPVLLGGSVIGLILVVVIVAIQLAGPQPSRPSQAVASVTPSPSLPGSGETATTFPRRLDEMPESERPQPAPFRPPTPEPPEPMSQPPDPAPQPMTEPVPTTPTPPPPTPMPAPSTPEPMPDPGPSREELRALAQALTTVRAAIGEQNFPVADREITKALTLVKLDEHKAKIDRLQLLRDYVGRYRDAIGETLGRVSGGDQIELENGNSFGIVEKTPDMLVIRISGMNRRYPMNELPLGLASRLAEMSLDKASLDTTVMRAAFVSVNPKLGDDDRAKADAWWKEAASVSDVPDLILAINDDYSLKQDVMAVPLEPDAMAELTERADRLKDARTIEEFAKEFQAAIDESLKSLEPEMELTVGGGTVVTIKELKPDRVMLTVADEMRGFQFAKLPLGLAASIAERILPRDAPLTMVMKGAYYAAREKGQSNKQFRTIVLDWWKQAEEMDPQLQPVIQELVKQYPE